MIQSKTKVPMYDFVLTDGVMLPAEGGGVVELRIERGGDPVEVSVTRKLGRTLEEGRHGYWAKGPPQDHNRRETATDADEETRGPGAKKKTTRGPTGT